MKLKGGYNVPLAGRPAAHVEALPQPKVLRLPLFGRRFRFSELQVDDGQNVAAGQVLARDPSNYGVPLLAPLTGTVQLNAVKDHIVLQVSGDQGAEPKRTDAPRDRREKLLVMGAWRYFFDAHTEALPDPHSNPQAVIVCTLNLQPFVARGDVQLKEDFADFTGGLEQLQSLLEYQPIYLVLPDIRSAFATEVRQKLRGYAWVRLVDIPLRYGLDNFAVLARALGLKRDNSRPVWALRTEGVIAVNEVLAHNKPCTERIISVGGPAVKSPTHLRVLTGYPLEAILESQISDGATRVINGGVLDGQQIDADQTGLDSECTGLTILPEVQQREMLSFARPGWDRRSYSRCYLSVLRKAFEEPMTTALRGERRACVSCNYCDEVCPARIMPHLIHKYLYQDKLEEAQQAGVELCVRCGLCSYVCPSKIELRQQFIEAQQRIQEELQEQEQEATA